MQFQKKEKRQTTVRFDSHHVRLRTGEVQRKTGSYMYRWTDKLGKRNTIYEIKQQRGRVLDAVSSADIRNHGTKVVNPFIGVIPTHGELEDELEQIYEAM